MLSDTEIEALAKQHLKETYPVDCEILSGRRLSNPDGIYFVANRRSENPHDLYIGDGGFFVSRKSGAIWKFGSGHIVRGGLEDWLRFYDEGWRDGLYRLVVRQVRRPVRLAELFVQSHLSYVVLKLKHGVVRSRSIRYDEKTILQRIQQLPCSFSIRGVELRALIPTLESERVAVVEYSYIENPPTHDWRPEKYTADMLGPQWE